MGRVDGKVAFITGAARGQGRSHAVSLAREGADIIAVDICGRVGNETYSPATPEDLAETVAQVEALDRRILATQVDVRDFDGLTKVVDEGVAEFGRLDIVAANAGLATVGLAHELSEQNWHDMLDVNLTGVWHTAKASIPHLIAGGRGGSITITSSAAGVTAYANMAHYVAAKHGSVGLMRALALELAPHMIRVNTLNPTMVATTMGLNDDIYALFAPELVNPTQEQVMDRLVAQQALPIPWVEPVDISHALVFLASDEGRYLTGVTLPVDGGMLLK